MSLFLISYDHNGCYYFLERGPPIGRRVFAPMSYLHVLYHCPISSANISLCANRMCQILSLVSTKSKA
jgi:hypothetical protein